ncbi:O-acyltransferase like protein-like [Brevipalpus obovatus]|uniref:O-acyltransferase like protein-like n=1 Tax=Brevipalpus obovatus TaxID=246614 RepID=UPI003D9EF2FC
MLAPFLLMLSILGMPLICWTLNGTIIIASILFTGYIVYIGDHIPTLMLLPEFINGYYEEIYIKPWCRIGPYCFGLVLGEILSNVGRNFKINKILNTSLWLISIFTILFIIYYPYKFAKYGYDIYESVAYASLHRLAWSIVWSWMIFSMVTGNFPLADRFFSWPPFIFLSRLTYGVFLLQWLVYSHFTISNRTYLSATTSFGAVMITGIYMITNAGAFVMTLLIEYPTQSLLHIYQNYLLGSGGDKRFEIRPSALTNDQKNNPVKLTAVIRAHI